MVILNDRNPNCGRLQDPCISESPAVYSSLDLMNDSIVARLVHLPAT